MNTDQNHRNHQARFAARRDVAASARAPNDRMVERLLHTDISSLGREWQCAATLDEHGNEQPVWFKQFPKPLNEAQIEALKRALVDYGVIDDVNTPQTPGTYQLATDKEGQVWQLRIPEASYPKITLANEVYKALRAQGWEKQEYEHPSSKAVLYAYSKSFNAPLTNADHATTEEGHAVETALARFGLKRGTHYDWNDTNPNRLKMPEASYQRFMAAVFPNKPESPAR